MRAIVADTHALVWHLVQPARLGKAARRAFKSADAGKWLCHVPAIVLAEIALLHERGKLRLGLPQVIGELADHPGYAVLPIDLEQAFEFAAIPAVRDPIDRLIVAAARATNASVVSKDAALDGHGIDRLWD